MERRGISMTKVIWGVLFAALVIYLLASLLRAGSGDVSTVTAVSYTVENACTARGIVVRDETLLVSGEEYVDVRPADGEKVGVGQVLAVTCSDEEQLALLRRMDELELSISQLGSILSEEIKPSKAVEMDGEIVTKLTELTKQRSGGDLFGATSKIAEIKSLVIARSVLSSTTESVQQKLDSMKNELIQVINGVSGSSRITSAASGTFSSQTDGFETVVTPDALGTITAAEIENLRRSEQQVPAGTFGKFVNGIKWYYAAVMDYNEVSGFRSGDTAQMRFLNGCGGDLKMTVERIDEPDKNGKCVIVLSCSSAMADTIGLRFQTAEIINDTIQGIRVPKSAMRVDENGRSGVYCVNGTTAVFRAADVIYDLEDYVLVAVNTDDTEHLRVGEKIIVGEKDLFEGKVVVND